MPNWANGTVAITGRKENVLMFTRRFIYDDTVRANIVSFFARSFAQVKRKEITDEIEELFEGISAEMEDTFCMNVDFAWSADNCLIDGYPQRFPDCVTLADACVADHVSVEILTEELGIGFEENILCDKEGKVTSQCWSMPVYICPSCGSEYSFPTYLDLSQYECPLCETIGLRLQTAG